jgi:sigma-54 specific flagellar transcriptional regulator A
VSQSAITDEPRVPDFLFSDDEPSGNDNAEFVLPGLTEEGIDLKTCLSEMERVLIVQALELSGGVVAKAAKLLNLQRTTLVEKMRKQGLERSD